MWKKIVRFFLFLFFLQEGTVCIYNDEMQLYKTFKAPTDSCKMRDLWITDFVFMPILNKVAVSYTSKELSEKNKQPNEKIFEKFHLLIQLFLKCRQN